MGSGFELGIYVHITNLQTFLALQGVWAQKLNFFSFYKSTNIFGSKGGLGFELGIYAHYTNLQTFLTLQGVPSFKVEFYFLSPNLLTFLA